MSDLPEHARGPIPELSDLNEQIEALEDQLIVRRAELRRAIDQKAQDVARFGVGYVFQNRSGARFRVTKIVGDYMNTDLTPEPITFVRYRGVRLYKNGNEGREETVFPV